VRAALVDGAFVEDEDLVGAGDGGEAVAVLIQISGVAHVEMGKDCLCLRYDEHCATDG
jgi:hypothetical protein